MPTAVAADGEEVVAQPVVVDDEIHHRGEAQVPQKLDLQDTPEDLAGQHVAKRIGREETLEEAIRDEAVDPADRQQHAERRHERGDAKPGGDQAVQEPDEQAGADSQQYSKLQRPLGVVGDGRAQRREHADHADRQIELAGDHQHSDAERGDADERDCGQADLEVGDREEAEIVGKQRRDDNAREKDGAEQDRDTARRMVAQAFKRADALGPHRHQKLRLATQVFMTTAATITAPTNASR